MAMASADSTGSATIRSITEDEAANILAYFDKDKDGFLQYHEFMTMLQATKTSVLTQVMSKHEC